MKESEEENVKEKKGEETIKTKTAEKPLNSRVVECIPHAHIMQS